MVTKFLKENYKRYLIFSFANLIAAINFNLLLKPVNIVSGGSPGLSLLFSNIFNVSTSNIIMIVYIITFILSIIFLDKKTLIGIIYASIIYPCFIYITDDITNLITLNYNDILLITLIGGILSGISNGLIYKNGFAASGLSVIAPIINKYFKVSISLTNFIMNSFIILLGGFFFGINNVLYAIILIYLSSYISNVIILGISTNKIMFIKTQKEDEINNLLINKYHITSTIFEEKKLHILMVVMSNRLYYSIKKELLLIDKNITFITNDCYEVVKK